MDLGDRQAAIDAGLVMQRLAAFGQEGEQVCRALQRGAPTDAQEMFVKDMLLLGGDPGDVIGEACVTPVEFADTLLFEDAQAHRCQRLNGVLHLVQKRCLQTDQIAGKQVIQYLPPAVLKQLVAKRHASENRVEVWSVTCLRDYRGASVGNQFALLETLHEIEFRAGKFPELSVVAEGTFVAGRTDIVMRGGLCHQPPTPAFASATDGSAPTMSFLNDIVSISGPVVALIGNQWMDADRLRIVVFEIDYFIALDVQRVITEELGWETEILSPGSWYEMLAAADFDLIVTSLSPVEQDNVTRVRDVEQRRRGIVFTTTISIEPERSGARDWPVVDLPFAEQALIAAVTSAARRPGLVYD